MKRRLEHMTDTRVEKLMKSTKRRVIALRHTEGLYAGVLESWESFLTQAEQELAIRLGQMNPVDYTGSYEG
jgi:hypothetical protein